MSVPGLVRLLNAAIFSPFLATLPVICLVVSWHEVDTHRAHFNTCGPLALAAGLIGLEQAIITGQTITLFVIIALARNPMTLPIVNHLGKSSDDNPILIPDNDDSAHFMNGD